MLLDDDNVESLLEFYNKIWGFGNILNSWKEAIVVSLYKGKGFDTDPQTIAPFPYLTLSTKFSPECYRPR